MATLFSGFSPQPYSADQATSHPVHKAVPFSECIVPRNLQADRYHAVQSQKEYIEGAWNICQDLISELPRTPTLAEVLQVVGKRRYEIAKGSSNREEFGALRSSKPTDKITTDLCDDYAAMAQELCQLEKDHPTLEWEMFSDNPKGYCIGSRKGINYRGETILLSRYLFSQAYIEKAAIGHTWGENLTAALDHCSYLFQQILRLECPLHSLDIGTLIAELHWWLAQACPYKRGSASCTEIIIGALTIYKLKIISPYRQGVFADRIALVSSMEEFVALYPDLREPPPLSALLEKFF